MHRYVFTTYDTKCMMDYKLADDLFTTRLPIAQTYMICNDTRDDELRTYLLRLYSIDFAGREVRIVTEYCSQMHTQFVTNANRLNIFHDVYHAILGLHKHHVYLTDITFDDVFSVDYKVYATNTTFTTIYKLMPHSITLTNEPDNYMDTILQKLRTMLIYFEEFKPNTHTRVILNAIIDSENTRRHSTAKGMTALASNDKYDLKRVEFRPLHTKISGVEYELLFLTQETRTYYLDFINSILTADDFDTKPHVSDLRNAMSVACKILSAHFKQVDQFVAVAKYNNKIFMCMTVTVIPRLNTAVHMGIFRNPYAEGPKNQSLAFHSAVAQMVTKTYKNI